MLYPKPTKESTEEALRLFSRAIELDPNFVAPYAAATRCYSARKAYGWVTDPAVETVETSRLIQRAIKLGTDDAFVLGLSGFQTFYVLGDVKGGAALLERARALNPNLAILWGGSGLINVCLGQSDIGIKQIEHASHAFLGNADEAQKAVAHLQSVEPGWRLSNLPDLRLVRQAQDRERFVEGLRRAGLPE